MIYAKTLLILQICRGKKMVILMCACNYAWDVWVEPENNNPGLWEL